MQYNAIHRKHLIHSLHTIHTIRTIITIHTAGGYMVRTHLTHPHVKHSKVSANERSNRYSPTYPVWLKCRSRKKISSYKPLPSVRRRSQPTRNTTGDHQESPARRLLAASLLRSLRAGSRGLTGLNHGRQQRQCFFFRWTCRSSSWRRAVKFFTERRHWRE